MSKTYVKTGLPGYGPDLDNDDVGIDNDDVRMICEVIREELDHLIMVTNDSAENYAEAEDYEAAWKAHKRCDDMAALQANLDYDGRATAPLYRDDPAALDATMRRIVAETFPLDVTDNLRLYVWEADDES